MRTLVGLLIMASFSLAGVAAAWGITHDRRKWLAVLVAALAGGFLLLTLWWNSLG